MTAVRKIAPTVGLKVEEIPIPKPGFREVLVAVETASICGTDLHIMHWDDWSSQRIKPPITIGHEFAGTVIETGKAVENVMVGDYVSAESHVTCGNCIDCKSGNGHICPRTSILGVDRDGAFADFLVIPDKVIWHNNRAKLPPVIATLQESFGNAVMATLSNEIMDKAIGVMGCGPLGLYSIAVARAAGACRILATDLSDYRLGLAKKMGADDTLNIVNSKIDPAQWIIESNGGIGVDVTMEMSGAVLAIDAALKATRNGGRVTFIGIPPRPVEIDLAERLIFKNLTVAGLNGRRIFDTWHQTRDLLESKQVDLNPLVSHEMELMDIHVAMEILEAGEAAKIVLRPRLGVETAQSFLSDKVSV